MEVTEEMRLEAINNLIRWQVEDPTVKALVRAVIVASGQPSIGHIARFEPDLFDELYEECAAFTRNDL